MKTLVLKAGRDKSVKRRHPWIFSGAVERVEGVTAGSPGSGETVLLKSAEGKTLALAAYSPQSQIRARVWSFDPGVTIKSAFFETEISVFVLEIIVLSLKAAICILHDVELLLDEQDGNSYDCGNNENRT